MAAGFSSSKLYLAGFLQHHYKISVHFSRILCSQALGTHKIAYAKAGIWQTVVRQVHPLQRYTGPL